jgi:hypothetical protein
MKGGALPAAQGSIASRGGEARVRGNLCTSSGRQGEAAAGEGSGASEWNDARMTWLVLTLTSVVTRFVSPATTPEMLVGIS